MIQYQDLSSYEIELINSVIPKAFAIESQFVDFMNSISIKFHRENKVIFRNGIAFISNVHIDYAYRMTIERIKAFFLENDFMELKSGRENDYRRLPNGDKLRKAGSIEKYFKEEKKRIEEIKRLKPHIGDKINVTVHGNMMGNALGNQASLREVEINLPITTKETPQINNPTPKPHKNVFGNIIAIIGVIVAIVALLITYSGWHR